MYFFCNLNTFYSVIVDVALKSRYQFVFDHCFTALQKVPRIYVQKTFNISLTVRIHVHANAI